MPRAAATAPARPARRASKSTPATADTGLADQIVNAIADPVIAIDADQVVRFVNQAAQEFLAASAARLVGRPLAEVLPEDAPLFYLIDQAIALGRSMAQSGVMLETPRIGGRFVDLRVTPLHRPPARSTGRRGNGRAAAPPLALAVSSDPGDTADGAGNTHKNNGGQGAEVVQAFGRASAPGDARAVITIQERTILRRIDNQLSHRSAARSVTAMAAMLAHEVKNPLSGIRGAAQLLEQGVEEQDRLLTRLICDEADRIVALVDRMEVFADRRPTEKGPVNIHAVLDHVKRIAQNGFARTVRVVERYDPSLPPVYGNRDQLVQVLLNLIKNAAEAVPATGGEIILGTAYQRGVYLAVPGVDRQAHLPLAITVQDNGAGIPDDLRDHLFDAFVTTKPHGSGLGLALVAKIIGDHGGTIEVDSLPRRTVFKISLPAHADGRSAADDGPGGACSGAGPVAGTGTEGREPE